MPSHKPDAIRNLGWTGNLFLDQGDLSQLVGDVAARTAISSRGTRFNDALRAALADHLGVPESWIAIGAGSSQLLDALLSFLPIDTVLEAGPGFHLVRKAAYRKRIPYHDLALRDVDDLPQALATRPSSDRTLLVVSSPRNPRGDALPAHVVAWLVAQFPGVVVIDEAYSEFAQMSAVEFLRQHPRLVVVRTFSKAWGLADLRVGYAASQLLTPSLGGAILPYSVGGVAEGVACEMLAQPGAVQDSISRIIAARARLATELAVLPGVSVLPSSANFLCIELDGACTVAETLLRQERIRVVVLADLPQYPVHWPAGLRITVPPAPLGAELVAGLGTAIAESIDAQARVVIDRSDRP